MEHHWKAMLADVLRAHNHRHGRRDKIVSNLTMQQRGDRLFDCFEQLRELGYRLDDPTHIGERHVQALVDHWVARQQSAATIQTKLSHLRVFATWIAKPGLVKRAVDYVPDADAVTRLYAARCDASWTTKHIDPESVIVQLRQRDPQRNAAGLRFRQLPETFFERLQLIVAAVNLIDLSENFLLQP